MAHIDALIDKISDPSLKADLRHEVDALLSKQSFGLVFQEHKPETVLLPNYAVRQGCVVAYRNDSLDGSWVVEQVDNGVAHLRAIGDPAQTSTTSVNDLAVVRKFGQPIYPGLRSVGRIEQGGSKPFHIVVNAENHHALETLVYTCEGQVDAIYIDPPYNTGAKDWTYNNDFVDTRDRYRHSKWLAFMERRLRIARRLLKPDSALVVTIDEHEVHHIGMLLEQLFPDARIQMVTMVTNGAGVTQESFSRVEEYAIFCFFGNATPNAIEDDMLSDESKTRRTSVWFSMVRYGGINALPSKRPNLVYPIYIDPATERIVATGPTLQELLASGDLDGDLDDWRPQPSTDVAGHVAVWPFRKDGSLATWQTKPETLQDLIGAGFVRVRPYGERTLGPGGNRFSVSYIKSGNQSKVLSGEIPTSGREPDGGPFITGDTAQPVIPKTVWRRARHDAGKWGSRSVRELLGSVSFDYAKSPYAVLDTLRALVSDKPDALVLDFFAGSGTTLHSLAMLNAEDEGSRRSILVTNNQVDEAQTKVLKARGLRPGDPEWEERGIFAAVTMPRVRAAVTGQRGGIPISGAYQDGRDMADGFNENVEFFELTYEDPDEVSLGKNFNSIAPLLWLRAGGQGPKVESLGSSWTIPDGGRYGVLFDVDEWRPFVEEVSARGDLTVAYVVCDSEAAFQQVASEIPSSVLSVRLYDNYLRSFEINTRELV